MKEEVTYISKDGLRFSTKEGALEQEAWLDFDHALRKLEDEIKMTISVSEKSRQQLFKNRELMKSFFDRECGKAKLAPIV